MAAATPETGAPVHCPHFGPCGGCSFLGEAYAAELAAKEAAFLRAASRCLALDGVRVTPVLAARAPLFYRTSLKVPFGWKRGKPVVGFYRPGSHDVVDLSTCAIQHPVLTRLLILARECAAELGTPVYDERSHKGLLRHFLARYAPGTGQSLAGFVVRYDHDRATQRLAERLLARGAELGLVGVVENVQRERGSRVVGEETRVLAGQGELCERVDGLEFTTSLTTFAQVNAAQASVLYAEVARRLEPLAGKHVVDLFSGYGPIGLRLAARGAEVHAVEYSAQAVREGERAAQANGLAARITFAAGDAGRLLARHVEQASRPPDAIVVDPPRRGLSRAIVERLGQLAVQELVVVSCDPDTLLRDLGWLTEWYELRELATVDLFPRTPHLESIAYLTARRR